MSYITNQFWLHRKFPRQGIKSYTRLATALDLYFSLAPEQRLVPLIGSTRQLFDRLWEIKGKRNLVSLVYALFIGGTLTPRHGLAYHAQLAHGYQYAQRNNWLLGAPVFGEDFGGAVCWLAKNRPAEVKIRVLVLALIALDKLQTKNIPQRIIALNTICAKAVPIQEEIARLKRSGQTAEYFNPAILLAPGKEALDQRVETATVILIAELAAKEPTVFSLLADSPVAKPGRSEEALFTLANNAPRMNDPFIVIDWLLTNRLPDYALATHVQYLDYAKKLASRTAINAAFIAGAFDWAFDHQGLACASIEAAIAAIPKDKYPTPFLIAKEIMKAKAWAKEIGGRLGRNFTYLAVTAAFHLNKEKLSALVMARQQKPQAGAAPVGGLKRPLTKLETHQLAALRKKRWATPSAFLTSKERALLLELAKIELREAVDLILHFYTPLVNQLAGKRAANQTEFEDLRQIGLIKLIGLVERFSNDGRASFEHYITTSLRWYLFTYHQQNTGLVHLPSNQFGELRKINKLRAELTRALGREPTKPELAAILDISIEELDFKIQLQTNSSLSDDGQAELSLAAPTANTPDEALLAADYEDKLRKGIMTAMGLAGLSEKEKVVVTMLFLSQETPTLIEIGKKLNLTGARIGQLKESAINKLLKSPYAKQLKALWNE